MTETNHQRCEVGISFDFDWGGRGVEREENLLVSVLFFGGDGVSFPFYFNLEQHSPFPTVQNNYTMALPTFTDFPINR